MPTSTNYFKKETKDFIINNFDKDCKILDVGAGVGTYYNLLKNYGYYNIDCVEVFSDYIKNYIELQQVRLTEKTTVAFSAEGLIDEKLVAPLVFIPFVENAFKYGISTKSVSHIEIKIEALPNSITLFSSNFIVPTENNMMENTGIGINNVKRRLELMYPGKYTLTNEIKDNFYLVHLEITTS